MGKIGDIWVRLGLKKQDFDKGIDQAERRLTGFGKAFNVLKGVAVAAFAAIVTAAAGMFDTIIHKSQALSDNWDRITSQMSAAWDVFLGSLAAWDWDNFGERIKRAMGAAAVNTQAHDELTEVQNANRIKRAQMQDELAQLQILTRDTSKSQEERAAAVKRYMELVSPLYEAEIKAMEKIRKSEEALYLEKAGVEATGANMANLEGFLKNIAPDRDAMNAFLKKAQELQGERVSYTKEELQAIEAISKSDSGFQGNAIEALANIAWYYQKHANDLDTENVIAAIEKSGAAAAGLNEETRRLQNIGKSANTGSSDAARSAWKAGRDQAKQIQQQAEDSLKSEETLLQEHYERDKKLLQKYHLDTTALDAKYENDRLALVLEGLEDIEDAIKDFNDEVPELDIFGDDDDLRKASERMKALTDVYDAGIERMQQLKEEFIHSVVTGFSDGIQELSDQLMGLSEVNPGRILQALLSPLADMAVREGEIVMATGLGVEAVKKSLESLEGTAAIVAGAALIAIGAAAKSGLAALANNGSGTTTSSYSGAGSAGNQSVIRSELVVRVEGTLKGSDIVLSGTNTVNSWNR